MRLSLFSILVLFLLTFLGTYSCKNPYQQKCQEICGFYVSCVEKQFPNKADLSQKNFFQMECESGCLREQSFAMPCYEAEKTCVGFTRCLLDSGLMD
ncbi:Cys-rich protein [Leptospira langatensis]|uniref:Cys-rich protein n=2 Tax=Leptospira langatensis TaxID=2484983 RepID=A0A5F1ZS57_9LEPT|nr:Cys-rich protein [Leptospira langatensis]TGJ99054.1 Cys-rich protein [Leptospira langatensis]TGL40757.1 Cys-rich protein [Leptospira langatensis]